jgi:hypothetical protein
LFVGGGGRSLAGARLRRRSAFLDRQGQRPVALVHRDHRSIGHVAAQDRKIKVTLDAKAKKWLAEAGYDPVFGARPLKRVIQRSLQDPLATLILEGKIGDGAGVKVSAGKRGLIINGTEFAANSDDMTGRSDTETPSHAVH